MIDFGQAEGLPRGAEDGEVQCLPVIWVFRLEVGLVAFCRVARTAAEATALATGTDARRPA